MRNGIKLAHFCQLLYFAKGFNGSAALATAEVDGNGVSPPPALLAAFRGQNITFTADSEGAFNSYLQAPVNANRETTSGLDFQMDYTTTCSPARWTGTSWAITPTRRPGLRWARRWTGLARSAVTLALNPLAGFTEPKLRTTIAATYNEGPWSLTAQARLIGAAVLTNNLTQIQTTFTSIDNNSVPAVLYGDFRGSYRLERPYPDLWRGRQRLQRTAAQHPDHWRRRHELYHL